MRDLRTFRVAFSLIELIVVLGLIGFLFALLLPAIQKVRETSYRATCQNNQKQIALSLMNYHTSNNQFPAGKNLSSLNSKLRPDASWLNSILPYMGQDNLYEKSVAAFEISNMWWANGSQHPIDVTVKNYTCPSDDRLSQSNLARNSITVASTSYVGVSGTRTGLQNGVLYLGSKISILQIKDGSSQTLLFGERPPSSDFWFGWWYAGYGLSGTGQGDVVLGTSDVRLGYDPTLQGCPSQKFREGDFDNFCNAFHFWSLHPGGANFAFADGSVRFLSYSSVSTIDALATRNGREVVSID